MKNLKSILLFSVLSIQSIQVTEAQQANTNGSTSNYSNTVPTIAGITSTLSGGWNTNSVEISGKKMNILQENSLMDIDVGLGLNTGTFLPNRGVGHLKMIMQLSTSEEGKDGFVGGLGYVADLHAKFHSGMINMVQFGPYVKNANSFFMLSVSPMALYYDRDHALPNENESYIAQYISCDYKQDIGERLNLDLTAKSGILKIHNSNGTTSSPIGGLASCDITANVLIGKNKTTAVSLGMGISDQSTKQDNSGKLAHDTYKSLSLGIKKVI